MILTNITFYDKKKLTLDQIANMKRREIFNTFIKMDDIHLFRNTSHTFNKKYSETFTNYLIKHKIIGVIKRKALFISEFPISRFKKWIKDYKLARKDAYRKARLNFLRSLYDISVECIVLLSKVGIIFPLKKISKDSPFYKYNLYKYFILPTKRDNILLSMKGKRLVKNINPYFIKYLQYMINFINKKSK